MATLGNDARHDVVVVGAGIAGASAAYFLSRKGLDVAVLDKAMLPRYKPCGGGVPRSAFALFPFSFEPVVEREVLGVRYSFRGEREVAVALPSGLAVTVMRDRLDSFVLQQSGVVVAEGEQVCSVHETDEDVTIETLSGRRWQAGYVVAADGSSSVVARAMGLRTRPALAAALESEVTVSPDVMRVFGNDVLLILGAVEGGYLWVFPKHHHLSVGIATFRRCHRNLKAILRSEMGRLGIGLEGVPIYGHTIPVYRGPERLNTRRVALVGDAAGLVDPLLGEGIRYGIRSARLAAQSIADNDLASYSRRLHKDICRHLGFGRVWAAMFYKYPRACFETGVRNARLTRDFGRMFLGALTYGEMLLRLPTYLFGARRQCLQFRDSSSS